MGNLLYIHIIPYTGTQSGIVLKGGMRFSSVAQLCPTLCNPMNLSTPGLPVHHQLLEFTQTHVHWVSDAIQPSHPLSSPLILPSIIPSIRVLSNESALRIRWPKYWSFSFNISPSNQHPGLISFRMICYLSTKLFWQNRSPLPSPHLPSFLCIMNNT